ncbi:SCO family protein [Pseudoroseomonas sp. WGS1072]|uniref:SCO family protein n=1 Tax=Roseomonas sp. WGS1072 TaxID=3366816 RepID=UPI003BF33712
MDRRTLLLTLGIGIPASAVLGWGVSELMLRTMQGSAPERTSTMQQPIGSPFALTDHTGRRVTDASFAGTVRLVFFGFTHCPDICPTGLGYMAEVMDGLGDEAVKVRPLFISVDSGRDTPELLASYVTNFHPALIGLTGTEAEVAQVAKAFRTHYSKVPTGGDAYVMEHSASIYLLGPEGTLHGFLDTHEPVATAISKVRLALKDTGGKVSQLEKSSS